MRPIHEQYLVVVASRLQRAAAPYNGTVEVDGDVLTITNAPDGAEQSGDWTIRLCVDEEFALKAQDPYSPIPWNLTGARLDVVKGTMPPTLNRRTMTIHRGQVLRWLDMVISRRFSGTSLQHIVAMATKWMDEFHDLKLGAEEPRSYFDNNAVEWALYEQSDRDDMGINRLGDYTPKPWEDDIQPFHDFS